MIPQENPNAAAAPISGWDGMAPLNSVEQNILASQDPNGQYATSQEAAGHGATPGGSPNVSAIMSIAKLFA